MVGNNCFWGEVVSLSEILLLSAALSIDALSIGASCGLAGIRTPLKAKLVIMAVSVMVTGCAVLCGVMIGDLLPTMVGKILGAALLAVVGIYVIVGAFSNNKKNCRKKKRNPFGISAGILGNPTECDRDESASIDTAEAVFIGLALSADSFAAGIGAGVGGGSVILVPIICGVFQMVFLCCGEQAAKKLRKAALFKEKYFGAVSGSIMIATALCRLIF